MKLRKVPEWLSVPLILSAFGALVLFERRRPLRRLTESKLTRDARNLAVAAAGAMVVLRKIL